jgi:hypothetical protein
MRQGRSIGFALAAAGLIAAVSGCGPSEESLRLQAIEDQKFKPPVPDKPPPPPKNAPRSKTKPIGGPTVKGNL